MISIHNLKINIKAIVLLLIFCLFSINALKSQIEVKGFITDCEGEPLLGAYVMEQKTKKTAVTNIDGFYQITVPDTNSVIKYSFIGYLPKTIKVGQRDTINVTLSEDSVLLSKPVLTAKPVIYLYPEKETEISVKLNYSGKLLFTYPRYEGGWQVVANPNGKLINKKDDKEYSYLFWDGLKQYDQEDVVYENGFIVSRDNAVEFLQNTLPQYGLKPHEYNEFIVFWIPYLQQNEWNFVHFRTGRAYDVVSTNTVNPLPETEIRLFMDFKKIDAPFPVEPQKTDNPTRKGFTLVEWGGSELKQPIRIKSSNGNYIQK